MRIVLALLLVVGSSSVLSACKVRRDVSESTVRDVGAAQPTGFPSTTPRELFDFLTFVSTTITYGWSDIQGYVGAGSSVRLQKFGVADGPQARGGIISGGDVSLEEVTVVGPIVVDGRLTAKRARTANAHVSGDTSGIDRTTSSIIVLKQQRGFSRNYLAAMNREMFGTSRYYASLAEGVPVSTITAGKLDIQGSDAVIVANVNAEDIRWLRLLTIRGRADQIVVINVVGEGPVSLHGLDVVLQGLTLDSVLMNLPGVSSISIRETSNGSYGLPFSILAPCAHIDFFAGLVTGGIYAASLNGYGSPGLPGGQVNHARFRSLPGSKGLNDSGTPSCPVKP